MAESEFQIPEEYKSQVKYVDAKDKRTDAEILESLTMHAPITSERNIWTYWHAGVQEMPKWTQRNIINWVRLHGPDWTVRVLDTVPDSPNHALAWIATENLPEAFVKGTMTGPYVGPHSADFLRGAALYTYGGVWMDVGIILFRHLDSVCWAQLADATSSFSVAAPLVFGQFIANHIVASRKGDEFIKNWCVVHASSHDPLC
jgi:mannosyltransferase OCH1-like enzyme